MWKRGLSSVVATVLIVLLALAAVAIVWGFLGQTITSGGEVITLRQRCFNVEVKPTSCVYDTTSGSESASINIQYLSGDPEIVIGILELEDGSVISKQETAPSLLATRTINFAASDGISVSNLPVRARAAAIVKNKEDMSTQEVCPESTIVKDCTDITP